MSTNNLVCDTIIIVIIVVIFIVLLQLYLLEYIILENLTSRFTNPCVMDLKLGTRTHTDEMSEEKKQVHLKRCDVTTSKSLAIRLAGLQVLLWVWLQVLLWVWLQVLLWV